MTTIYLNVQVNNAFGLFAIENRTFELTGGVTPTGPVIDSIDISPASGPPGTLFTFTIHAHDTNTPPSALTYFVLPTYAQGAGGTGLVPVEGQPNVFTWQS